MSSDLRADAELYMRVIPLELLRAPDALKPAAASSIYAEMYKRLNGFEVGGKEASTELLQNSSVDVRRTRSAAFR